MREVVVRITDSMMKEAAKNNGYKIAKESEFRSVVLERIMVHIETSLDCIVDEIAMDNNAGNAIRVENILEPLDDTPQVDWDLYGDEDD